MTLASLNSPRDSKRSKNLQVEPNATSGMTLIKNLEMTHTLAHIYKWIPHLRDLEAGIL